MIAVVNRKTIRVLVFRQIKTAQSRNIFAVLAIVLTSVLVTALITIGFNLAEANKQMMMSSSGQKAEISFQYLTAGEAEKLAAHPLIT
jgi:putative ABC transport system permease protein